MTLNNKVDKKHAKRYNYAFQGIFKEECAKGTHIELSVELPMEDKLLFTIVEQTSHALDTLLGVNQMKFLLLKRKYNKTFEL